VGQHPLYPPPFVEPLPNPCLQTDLEISPAYFLCVGFDPAWSSNVGEVGAFLPLILTVHRAPARF